MEWKLKKIMLKNNTPFRVGFSQEPETPLQLIGNIGNQGRGNLKSCRARAAHRGSNTQHGAGCSSDQFLNTQEEICQSKSCPWFGLKPTLSIQKLIRFLLNAPQLYSARVSIAAEPVPRVGKGKLLGIGSQPERWRWRSPRGSIRTQIPLGLY